METKSITQDASPGGTRRIIHTPDDFAKRSLLHLQEIGELAPGGPYASSRSGLSSHLLLLVESGRGSLETGGGRRELSAGDVALVDCRGPYSHETGDEPWRLSWIHFSGPNLSDFSAEWVRRSGADVVHTEKPERFKRLWEEIWSNAGSADPLRDFRINDRLAALLTLLAEAGFGGGDGVFESRRQARLARVREWIEANCAKPDISLDDIAAVARVNKFTLVRDFRARYGMTPKRALSKARADRAKAMLRFSDDTVESICARCGVPDPNYFARMFRRVEGVSPSEFRFRWRERSAK